MKLLTSWFCPVCILPDYPILIAKQPLLRLWLEPLLLLPLLLLWIIFLIMIIKCVPHASSSGCLLHTHSFWEHVGISGSIMEPGSQGVKSGIHLPVSSFSWLWYPLGHLSCLGKQLPSSFWKNPSGHLPLSDLHLGSDGLNRQSFESFELVIVMD